MIFRSGSGVACLTEKGIAPALSYSHSRGLFAGISLEGSIIVSRPDVNHKFFGRVLTPNEILAGAVPAPRAAQPLYDALALFAGAGETTTVGAAPSSSSSLSSSSSASSFLNPNVSSIYSSTATSSVLSSTSTQSTHAAVSVSTYIPANTSSNSSGGSSSTTTISTGSSSSGEQSDVDHLASATFYSV